MMNIDLQWTKAVANGDKFRGLEANPLNILLNTAFPLALVVFSIGASQPVIELAFYAVVSPGARIGPDAKGCEQLGCEFGEVLDQAGVGACRAATHCRGRPYRTRRAASRWGANSV